MGTLAAVLSLVAACVTAAAAVTPPLEFSLAGGYANPIGATASQLGGGASLDVALQYNATDRLSAGLEAGYIFHLTLKGTGVTQVTPSDSYASIFHLTPEFKYGFPQEWK